MKFKIQANTLKGLLIHLSIVLGLFCILSFTVFYEVLPFVTNKDEIVTVPDLKGMSLDEAMEFIRNKDLRIEGVDSSYSPQSHPLTVLEQFPQPHSKVKPHRKISVTLNARIPPTITFPDLSGSTFDFAQTQLKNLDLRIGSVSYRPDIAHNTILESRAKGQKLSAGQSIIKGSKIDLVIGTHREEFTIPNFENMKIDEVEAYIFGMNLKLRAIHYLPAENEGVGTVQKQLPQAGETVRLGDDVELWIAN